MTKAEKMREILFRAKAINRDRGYHRTEYKNGDWVYGLITRLYDERFENLPAEMTDINGISGVEVDYKTIGQYTGLTDENGTKIFEGDIVTTDIARPYLIVEFRDGCFMFNCNDGGKDYYDIMLPIVNEPHTEYKCGEVIGNIHDNPEL